MQATRWMLYVGSSFITRIARRYFSVRRRSSSDGSAIRDRSQLSCRSASFRASSTSMPDTSRTAGGGGLKSSFIHLKHGLCRDNKGPQANCLGFLVGCDGVSFSSLMRWGASNGGHSRTPLNAAAETCPEPATASALLVAWSPARGLLLQAKDLIGWLDVPLCRSRNLSMR
jgi:hypothetical protein